MDIPYTPQDLADLHAACFEGSERWSAHQIAESLALPTTSLYLPESSGLTGFLLLQNMGSEHEILTVAVDPAQRRQGLGMKLLQAALAQPEGDSVFLEVAADNGAAIALYQKAGFVQNGLRRAYYRRETERCDALTYCFNCKGIFAPSGVSCYALPR